jgi:hypothetical protein
MNSEETEVYEFLKQRPNRFVPLTEISRSLATRLDCCHDSNWMAAILRRMEIEGWIEANPQGDYRLTRRAEETTAFKKALETPGSPLGDTAIVTLSDGVSKRAAAA